MKGLLLVLLSISVFANAQEKVTMEGIQDNLFNQLIRFPQEKIHLHTDRTMYVPGEKIWLKAYLTDAFTHESLSNSLFVYVELISSSDSLVHRVMIHPDDNRLFHGHIFLSEMIPAGDYTLRAYTKYMENQGDGYFFQKNIRIDNLKAAAKPANKPPKNTYEVSFFPEGGNLVEDVVCRVAFQALNNQGASEDITGTVVDNNNVWIQDVSTLHAGLGSFSFLPEPGKTYFLKCKNTNGQEKRFQLPPARKTFSLSASYRNHKHYIEIKRSPAIDEQPLYLLIHCRGLVLYFATYDNDTNFKFFGDNDLPSGVLQVVLFDQNMNPVSERLIFNKNRDQAELVFSTGKPHYQKREKVVAAITVTDSAGVRMAGHVSVAVTDDKDIAVDTLNTILSSLLLSSELRGTIESPGYYLQDNPNATIALDHLMMVHGWRRYAIADVVKGDYQIPSIEFEQSKVITGAVKSYLLGRPVADGEILFYASDGSIGQTRSDSAGRFRFDLLYPDSTIFFIQSKNQKGKAAVELVMKEEVFPAIRHAPVSPWLPSIQKQVTDTDDFIIKAGQRAQYDEDIKMIFLGEVEVTAKRIEKKDEARLRYWFNSSSDKTIYREQIEKRNATTVTQLLYGIAGVQVQGNGVVIIRGMSSLPLVLIDGIRMEWPERMNSVYDSPLEMVSAMDVESIDIFKGPSAAIFGMNGGGGAISITTRIGTGSNRLNDLRRNIASLNPIGYQQPVEFYAPRYDTPESRHIGNPDFRTTIFWKPDVLVSDDGEAVFEFYTSDFPTTYSVVMEGLSQDGKIIRKVETIEVK